MPATMPLAEVLATWTPGSRDQPWTWDDEEHDLHTAPCPNVAAEEAAALDGAHLAGLEVTAAHPDETSDVEHDCDGRPGCYQRAFERHLSDIGRVDQPVLLGNDGRVWDGHHRIVAARRLGFTHIPTEAAAQP